jgi:glycosyltransferase involved in cell wall biosynthesis
MVDDFVGRPNLGHLVPLGDAATPSPLDVDGRRGVAFVGNFRHLPNVEAVEHLCAAVLPRLDPALLAEHPVRIIGHGLDERVARVGAFPNVELVGWVEHVEAHLHGARVSVVPLLHGAGVKGKVIQSLLAGTPVVSSSVGVEGLELPSEGVAPVVVAADAHDMAAAVEALLCDDELWRAHRDAGLEWALDHHGRGVVTDAVIAAADHVMADPTPASPVEADGSSRRWRADYERVRDSVREALAALPPEAEVLVASGGDAELLDGSPVPARHFPSDATGVHLGRNPSGAELVELLEHARRRGATHLVVPSTQYWWWHHHPELRDRLAGLPPVDERRECRIVELCPEPTLVHVDPGVQDPEVAGAHLRELLANATTPVVHMPVDEVAAGVGPPLVRQRGVRGRTMVGLGAGPAVAARGEAAVSALRAALDGDARDLHVLAATIDDEHPVHLLAGVDLAAPSQRARITEVVDVAGRVHRHEDPGTGRERPAVSVVIATRDRSGLLDRCLASLEPQVAGREDVELVVVDDGSTDGTAAVVDEWSQRLAVRRSWLPGVGRSAAKNLGVMLARGDAVLLLDDDDRLLDGALDAYLSARAALSPEVAHRTAVLGHTDWAPELLRTPLMHHVTEVGCQFFSYPHLPVGEPLDWRHFWEGRLLVDRGLLVVEGLHDDRVEYSVDVELARRLDRGRPIAVRYEPGARGVMARPVDLESVVRRAHAKGIAQRTIVDLQPGDEELVEYCAGSHTAPELLERVLAEAARTARSAAVDEPGRDLQLSPEVAAAIDAAIRAATDLGFHGMALPELPPLDDAADRVELVRRPPELSVIVPVWSLTEQLATMATETLRRVREVAALGTEIVVVDNGSPVPTDLSAADRVVALTHNRGVGPAWNLGASVAAAPLLCFLNSDCEVTAGWDRALAHGATDGRRIVFPYTDHVDGQGPRSPDQAGTAGWCFMLHRQLFAEIGPFDEGFAPAYFEDTDYWHRAWEMGVDLSPVPAAVVIHERRTTGRHAPELAEVFERNRRRYEAKHGVELDAAPPFYSREVVEYPPSGRHRLARLRPWASTGHDRPRVFGIGLNKTGTSSLHAAVSHLGFSSVHHGPPELRATIEENRDAGRPMLHQVDPTLDAFCDIEAISSGYHELDRDYPGSKFVLTVREPEPWIASRVRHVQRNRVLRERGGYRGDFLQIDVDGWLAERAAHYEAVLEHFAGRPDDLLVLDLCGGQGWERLAPFLGWGRLPERAFPWENRDLDADLVGPERR